MDRSDATAVVSDFAKAGDAGAALVATEAAPKRRRERHRRPMTEAQRDLAGRYLPMAKSLVKPLKLSWPSEAAEFESAALYALAQAAQSYDPSRNVKFATFARYRIWGAVRDVQRRLISEDRPFGDDGPPLTALTADAEGSCVVVDTRAGSAVGLDVDALDEVEGWLRKLPAKHAEVCRALYVDGLSQGEAAARLDRSRSSLSALHARALELLKDVLEDARRRDRGPAKTDAPFDTDGGVGHNP